VISLGKFCVLVLLAWFACATPLRAQELPPADTVVSLKIEGLDFYPEERILAALHQKVGEPLDMPRLQEDGAALWGEFRIVAKDIIETRVPAGVAVTLLVMEMPVDFDARFVGNEGMASAKLMEWAGLPATGEVFKHQARSVRSRLLEGYKRQGYHFIEIDIVTREGEENSHTTDVIFEVREGPRVRCTGLFMTGNTSLPNTGWGFWSGGLRDLSEAQTKGRGLLSWWGKPYIEDVLNADLVAMRQVYRDGGWLEAKVEIDRLEWSDSRGQVKVHVVVDEGPRYTVSSVKIEAFDVAPDGTETPVELYFTPEELMKEFQTLPGVPLEIGRVQHDVSQLRTYYGREGYLDSRRFANPAQADAWRILDLDLNNDFENHTTAVTFRFAQGRQRFLREVFITGNWHTRDRVLRREINILPGQVASIEEIERSLSRVRATGYFSDQQDVDHFEPKYVLHETGDPDYIDLEVGVKEGRVVDFSISGGLTSDSGVVGLLSLAMRNFDSSDWPSSFLSAPGEIYRKEALHGNGEQLNVNLSPGSVIQFWQLRYRHPDLLGTHFNRTSIDVDLSQRDRIYRSHDEERTSQKISLGRYFGHDLIISFGPVLQTIELDDLDTGPLPSTLTDSDPGPTDFQGVHFDLRYTTLDHRWSPKNGHDFRWSNYIYGGAFGGDNDIVKSEVFYDFFTEHGEAEDGVNPSWYIGFAGGIADPGDPGSVHYSERFFLGGSSNLRGFELRGVGPNEGDYALGGETYLRGSLEYRYPLYSTALAGTSERREVFRGTLFLDWGVLDPEAFHLSSDETRASAGFGFGLAHPIPLTFNFGFPIREGPGDQEEIFSFRLALR
jgi:outer membrane protein insertion porin family